MTTFYVLPGGMESLNCGEFIASLAQAGFSFDAEVLVYSLNPDGDPSDISELTLEAPLEKSICDMVRSSVRVEVECVGKGTTVVSGLGSQHVNPIFSLSVGSRHLGQMPNSRRDWLHGAFADAAEAAGAQSVLVIADPADDFTSTLQPVGGTWRVDLMPPYSTMPYWPVEYWYTGESPGIEGLINPRLSSVRHGSYRVVEEA